MSARLVPLALASRGAAFVVPLVVAMWFGVSDVTDAWYWTLAFPTFALVLASTALGTAATPIIARTRSLAPARLGPMVGGLLVWTALGAGGVGLLICLAAPSLLPYLTRFSPDTQQLTTTFLWTMLPFMVLTSAGAVLRVTCEVNGHFWTVTATPLLRAAVVIGVTAASRPLWGPMSLPAGMLAGEAMQAAFWAAVLRRTGSPICLTVQLHPEVRQVGRDLAPILAGEVLVALNLIVDKAFAAHLDPGSVATLEYADRARVIPQTLLESTLLMVAYANWSNLRAQGLLGEARRAVVAALQWTLVLAAPCIAGMYIGRTALIRLLYERGAFTPVDTANTAELLGWYLPGVVPALLGILAVRAHVLERNLTLVFQLGALSVIGNAVFNVLLMGTFGLAGLAMSTTLNLFCIPAIYLWKLRYATTDSPRALLPVVLLASGSVLTALLAEITTGPPSSVFDLGLWAWAVPCLLLLAVGARWSSGRALGPSPTDQ